VNLSNRTTIPLWAVFTSIPMFIGAIMWVSFVAYQGDANAQGIKELKTDKSEVMKMLIEIKEDLAAIKEQLKK